MRESMVQAAPIQEAEEATIVGTLIRIQVDAGEDKITVRSEQRDIDCFYGDALRDQISNLIAGSTVEVTGFPTLSDRGQVAKIHQVTGVEHVSMEPGRVGRFEYGGRVYHLRNPLALTIEYADGLWAYHHDRLGLWGYAARREDALMDLHQNFDYLYRELVEDQDAELEPKAEELRKLLITLVETAGSSTAHA